MRLLSLLLALLCGSAAYAADNTVVLTPGVGVTMRSTDVGSGRQSPLNILGDTSGNAIYGTAGTANANVLTVQGIASGTTVPVSLTSTTITGTVAATQSGTWNIGTLTTVTGVTTVSTVTNLAQMNGAALLMGNGVTGTGSQRVTISSDNTAFGVIVNPLARAARNFPGATVGTSSAQALATNTATVFLQIQNTHASATVACAFGATAVLNSSTSVQLAAGQSASWGPNTSGVPTGALNCIASGASTPLYVEWL